MPEIKRQVAWKGFPETGPRTWLRIPGSCPPHLHHMYQRPISGAYAQRRSSDLILESQVLPLETKSSYLLFLYKGSLRWSNEIWELALIKITQRTIAWNHYCLQWTCRNILSKFITWQSLILAAVLWLNWNQALLHLWSQNCKGHRWSRVSAVAHSFLPPVNWWRPSTNIQSMPATYKSRQ